MSDIRKLRAAEHESLKEPEDECAHRWVMYGTARDGTEFYRCAICKTENEEPTTPMADKDTNSNSQHDAFEAMRKELDDLRDELDSVRIERSRYKVECDQLRAENNHLRMENGLAEFHKLKDQNAELLSRFSKLAELLGDPIGGEYCALEKAISELMREKAETIGELAVCEEHAQTMERDYEATIAENKREIAALQSQLSRICKEGFNNDDTIGGEPADDYVIRQLKKLKTPSIPVYWMMSGSREIHVDNAIAIEVEASGKKSVRFEDGGWNPADHCFFTEDQCRKYHGIPPQKFIDQRDKIASALERLAEELRGSKYEIE